MKKVGVIGEVEVFESSDVSENEMYMISQILPNMRKDGKLPYVKFASTPPGTNTFYKQPKWWQWRKRRRLSKMPKVTDGSIAAILHKLPKWKEKDE